MSTLSFKKGLTISANPRKGALWWINRGTLNKTAALASKAMNKFGYFITGPSGVGKTTLLDSLKEKKERQDIAVLPFDSISIPAIDEIRRYPSPPEWQRAFERRT